MAVPLFFFPHSRVIQVDVTKQSPSKLALDTAELGKNRRFSQLNWGKTQQSSKFARKFV